MARSPEFKIYDAAGEYQAACKEPELAAAVVAVLGEGSTIRHGHLSKDIVWTEGKDGHAAESYDLTRDRILETLSARHQEQNRRDEFNRYGGERSLHPLDY
jgi:hypothetical protein